MNHLFIYVSYTNITLYIAFGIIGGRSWNVLPMDMGTVPYILLQKARVPSSVANCKAFDIKAAAKPEKGISGTDWYNHRSRTAE